MAVEEGTSRLLGELTVEAREHGFIKLDRGLRNEGVLRPLAMKLARREQTAPVQCAAAAIGIVGRDSCTVARGDGSGVVNPWLMR